MIYQLNSKNKNVAITYKEDLIGYCHSGQVIVETDKDLDCEITIIEGDFELPKEPMSNEYLVIPNNKTEEFLQTRGIDPKWFNIAPEYVDLKNHDNI